MAAGAAERRDAGRGAAQVLARLRSRHAAGRERRGSRGGACGCTIDFSDDRPGRAWRATCWRAALEKVDELEVPDPATTPPMCDVLEAVRILRARAGRPGLHHGPGGPGAGGAGGGAARLRAVHPRHDARTSSPELIAPVLDYCVRVQSALHAWRCGKRARTGHPWARWGWTSSARRLHRKWAHPYDCQVIAGGRRHPDFPMSPCTSAGTRRVILPEMLATGAPNPGAGLQDQHALRPRN